MGRKFYDNTKDEVINNIKTSPVKVSWRIYRDYICTGEIVNGRTVRTDYNFRTKKATVWLTEREIKELSKIKKSQA